MKSYLILLSAIILGNFTYHYIHSLVFILFKSDKYEDNLAKKVAKEVLK